MAKSKTRTRPQVSGLIYDCQEYCINVDTREIWLHDYNDSEEPGIDHRMSTKFIKNLSILNGFNCKPIIIHMVTGGGCQIHGMAIYDAIKQSVAPIGIIAHGQASSMGTVILQAADIRVLMPNCLFMIHYGNTSLNSNCVSAISELNQLSKDMDTMISIYLERCSNSDYFADYSEKEIKSLLDQYLRHAQEWYLTAREAISYGFADAIYGDENFENIDVIKEGL